MKSARHDISTLVGNVVLHASLLINGQLNTLVDGPSQAAVVLAGVHVVRIILGVVDVVLRAVAAEPVRSDLKLAGAVAEAEEAEHAKQQADGLCRDGLDGTDVDGLAVVSQPVAKVDTGDHHLVELLAAHGAGHQDLEQGIFNVAMTPCILPSSLGDAIN